MIVRIKNQKFKIKNSETGFTLIELLASVVVLVVVGAVIAGIISSTLRGGNKANTIESIRQSGNYVLNQMAKDIEYAQPFDGKNTGLSDDGVTYDTSCRLSLSPTPVPITPYKFIAVESANNVVARYKCTSSPELLKDEKPLIDETMAASVLLKSCSLNCIQDKPTDIPIIKISFKIGPKNSTNPAEDIVFETSVTIRNYEK